MNAKESTTLAALDRKIDADPAAMTVEQIRLYRELLARYVSQMTAGSPWVTGSPRRAGGPATPAGAARNMQ